MSLLKLITFRKHSVQPASPEIVSDGLVLHLDAGDVNSYPGTGTTWTDLSGLGNSATLVGPTYNNSNGGHFILDGINDYINLGNFFNYAAFTIELAAYINTSQGSYSNMVDNSHLPNFTLQRSGNFLGGHQYTWYCVAPGNIFSQVPINLLANQWYYLTLMFTGSRARVFVNGVYHNEGSVISSISYSSQSLRFGAWRGSSRYFSGRFGVVVAYDRALENSEVLDNFEVFRGRYGL